MSDAATEPTRCPKCGAEVSKRTAGKRQPTYIDFDCGSSWTDGHQPPQNHHQSERCLRNERDQLHQQLDAEREARLKAERREEEQREAKRHFNAECERYKTRAEQAEENEQYQRQTLEKVINTIKDVTRKPKMVSQSDVAYAHDAISSVRRSADEAKDELHKIAKVVYADVTDQSSIVDHVKACLDGVNAFRRERDVARKQERKANEWATNMKDQRDHYKSLYEQEHQKRSQWQKECQGYKQQVQAMQQSAQPQQSGEKPAGEPAACPFCRHSMVALESTANCMAYVRCANCSAKGPHNHVNLAHESIESWNRIAEQLGHQCQCRSEASDRNAAALKRISKHVRQLADDIDDTACEVHDESEVTDGDN